MGKFESQTFVLSDIYIEKNCFDDVLYIVVNQKCKTKENANWRHDLEELKIHHESHLVTILGKKESFIPNASYVLNADKIVSIFYWLKHAVKLPNGYSFNIGRCDNMLNNTFNNIKARDYHVFMQRLLPIALRYHLDDSKWTIISEFRKFFRLICSKDILVEVVKKLDKFIVVTLCKCKVL